MPPRGRATAHLATLRDYLTLAPEGLRRAAEGHAGQQRRRRPDRPRRNRHLGKSDREAAGVLSAAQRHTHFLDSPRMSPALGLRFPLCRSQAPQPRCSSSCRPIASSTYSRWLRLLVAQSLTDMARDPAKPARAGPLPAR
jgi:type IV secretion system protein VirD4